MAYPIWLVTLNLCETEFVKSFEIADFEFERKIVKLKIPHRKEDVKKRPILACECKVYTYRKIVFWLILERTVTFILLWGIGNIDKMSEVQFDLPGKNGKHMHKYPALIFQKLLDWISINLVYKDFRWYSFWFRHQKYEIQDSGSNMAAVKMVQTCECSWKFIWSYDKGSNDERAYDKGLYGALLDFVQENSELRMADPIWLPSKYYSILVLHNYSIWLYPLITIIFRYVERNKWKLYTIML